MLIASIGVANLSAQPTADQPRDHARQGIQPLSKEARFELAKRMLADTKQKVWDDPGSADRRGQLVQFLAAVEPVWMADLILNRPITDSGNLLYDNNAVLTLLGSQLSQLDDDTVMKLVEQGGKQLENGKRWSYGKMIYANQVLRTLEKRENRPSLWQRLEDSVSQEPEPQGLEELHSRLAFAQLSGNQELEQKIRQGIVEYFESGKALEHWKQISANQNIGESYLTFLRARYLHFAPEKFRGAFEVKADTASQKSTSLPHLLAVHSSSKADVLEQLAKVERFEFGQFGHEMLEASSQVGILARFDLERAQAIAEECPDDVLRAWCLLLVATTVAQDDKPSAAKLIRSAYREFDNADSSDRLVRNHDASPALLAAGGLPIVAQIAPEQIPECLQVVSRSVDQLANSRSSSAGDHLYFAISMLGRYDAKAGKKAYQSVSDSVALHDSGAFMKAMLVYEPELIEETLQSLPENDDRGVPIRLGAKTAILPALVAQNDSLFWQAMPPNGFRQDERILSGWQPESE